MYGNLDYRYFLSPNEIAQHSSTRSMTRPARISASGTTDRVWVYVPAGMDMQNLIWGSTETHKEYSLGRFYPFEVSEKAFMNAPLYSFW